MAFSLWKTIMIKFIEPRKTYEILNERTVWENAKSLHDLWVYRLYTTSIAQIVK